jgi:hypothetical protein
LVGHKTLRPRPDSAQPRPPNFIVEKRAAGFPLPQVAEFSRNGSIKLHGFDVMVDATKEG